MDISKFDSELQYVERNGCTFNIEEKIMLKLAYTELMADLNPSEVFLSAKITGK